MHYYMCTPFYSSPPVFTFFFFLQERVVDLEKHIQSLKEHRHFEHYDLESFCSSFKGHIGKPRHWYQL